MISIIVPVYNAEKYLNRCVDSILSQTYTDIELILINDGSTDSSGELCKKYAESDSRVKYFSKENEGPGVARFFGAQMATGEYICFVDSDDYLSEDALELLLGSFSDDVDCVIGQHKRFGSVDNIKQVSCPVGTFDFRANNKKLFVDSFLKNMFGGELWNKLFRTSVVKNACNSTIGFPFGEDTFYLISIFANCRKVICIDKTTYYYEFRSDSLARRTSDNLSLPFFAIECIRLKSSAFKNISEEIYALITLYMMMIALVKYSYNTTDRFKKLKEDFESVSNIELIQCFANVFLNKSYFLKKTYGIEEKQYKYFYCICKTIVKNDIWYYCDLYPAMLYKRTTVFKVKLKRIMKHVYGGKLNG